MKTRDFFLALGTVIIGILITFGGNAIIQRRVENSATAHILLMVKAELEDNIMRVNAQKERLEYEQAGAKAIAPYIKNITLIPIDTLKNYGSMMSTVTSFYAYDSFEVLKSSPQIETIKNKELLRDIFAAYNLINIFEGNIGSLYEPKAEMVK